MFKFCVAIVLAACVLTCANPALGADPEEGQYYRIKNVQSNKVLSVSGTDMGEGAMIVPALLGFNYRQQWKFVKIGDYYKVVNRETGLALNVQSASKEEGAPIIQWDASIDNENQQWSLVKKGEIRRDQGKAQQNGAGVGRGDEGAKGLD